MIGKDASQMRFSSNNGGHNNLIESLKPMLLTMMMVNSNKPGDSNNNNNTFNMIWSIIALSIIEWILANAKQFIEILIRFTTNYVNKNIKSKITDKLNNSVTNLINIKSEKKSTMTTSIDLENSKTPIIHAILDIITNSPNTKSILFVNNTFTLNYYEPIELNKDLFVKLVDNAGTGTDPNNAPISSSSGHKQESVEIYSFTLNMTELREAIDIIVRDYLNKIKNKLGNQIFYFNQINTLATGNNNNNNNNKNNAVNGFIQFTMKPFFTNRKFYNLFGEEIKLIRKRVEFFRDNKKWYDQKGIPYTLGILMSGQPGAGKTSTIKCLANELKRHIINIQLTNEKIIFHRTWFIFVEVKFILFC